MTPARAFDRYPTKRLMWLAVRVELVVLVLSLGYVAFFHAALVDGEWMDVDGFTRIVIPDTFIYAALLEDFWPLGFTVAGVKNAIGPALLWVVAESNWYIVAVLNNLLLLATLLYVVRLCEHLRVPPRRSRTIVLLLGLMPVMVYYSAGALKELPTLAAMTAFYYHFIKRQTWRWLLMAFVLILFRYQTVAVLGMFFLIERYARNPLRTAVIAMLLASMAYPLLSQMAILAPEATAEYREDAGSERGAIIENVRDTVPVASAVAVAIRVGQSMLEPLVTFAGSFSLYEDASFSVLAFVYLASLLLVLPAWVRTLKRIARLFRVKRPALPPDLASLCALIVLFVVPVGGFSFVHHRYLFPITALVLIAGMPLTNMRRKAVRSTQVGAPRFQSPTTP